MEYITKFYNITICFLHAVWNMIRHMTKHNNKTQSDGPKRLKLDKKIHTTRNSLSGDESNMAVIETRGTEFVTDASLRNLFVGNALFLQVFNITGFNITSTYTFNNTTVGEGINVQGYNVSGNGHIIYIVIKGKGTIEQHFNVAGDNNTIHVIIEGEFIFTQTISHAGVGNIINKPTIVPKRSDGFIAALGDTSLDQTNATIQKEVSSMKDILDDIPTKNTQDGKPKKDTQDDSPTKTYYRTSISRSWYSKCENRSDTIPQCNSSAVPSNG